MSQGFIDIECNVTEGFAEASLQTFTANELAERLSVSVRSIYGYANRILEAWHWLPESEFRTNGIYLTFPVKSRKAWW
ncbi:MAG: HTH domain-containing protein [Nostoc sp. ChiSLP02]|nr:HTH domain-containing protein [Nostoc sp. DedSLP05]MDZ8100012.1 HTH domain-containing protein [Nostoc sp. DedSLP01]MDZ8186569.1 HTH domain-containing protein [Nostoc sp. ChiSLP02]